MNSLKPYRVIRQSSAAYPVYVAPGSLTRVGDIVLAKSQAKRCVVISSRTVFGLYGAQVVDSLKALGSDPGVVLMSDAERDKNLETVDYIVTQLLELGCQRDTAAVVLGGGVVGDTGGFSAAIYLRGIDLFHVPTTLLAQVDSSVGGKLAVNHPLGKNLIGSFYPPKAVITDPSVLKTLPPGELLSGVFESLKGGVIGDPELFELMEGAREKVLSLDEATMQTVIGRSVDVKGRIVSEDEREEDQRRLLNYGHTLGHALETALDYDLLTHGEAVAWGMIGANAIAVRRGVLPAPMANRIDQAILAYQPARIIGAGREALMTAVSRDKKFRAGRRVMVLPRSIGQCEVDEDLSNEDIEYGLTAMLAAGRQ